jgi:hypothetical protein
LTVKVSATAGAATAGGVAGASTSDPTTHAISNAPMISWLNGLRI